MTSCSTNTCGVGGWGGPLPGDPSNDLVLSAVPVLAGIEVSWSYPTTNPQAVAFVKLLRGSSTNVESAIEIARVAGNSYYDRQNNNNTWYYWIRVTSSNGTEAALIGPASAAAVPTAGQLVELVQGAITASALHSSLGEKIGLIDAVDARLTGAIANREEAESLLAAALAQANNAIDYVTGTLVTENAERVAAVGAAVDAIDQEVLDRINSDDAVKTELRSEFESGDADAYAAATSWTQTYTYNKATIDGAITFAGQQLKADYEAKDGATLTSANAYTNTYTYAKATVDSSIATAVTNLTTAFAAGDSATRADTREYAYGKSTVDSAIAAASSTLTTSFTNADTTNLDAAKTYAEGYVQTYSYSKSTIDGNISSLGSTLTSTFNAGLANKNKVFRQSSQPTTTTVGDVWINTTAGANNEMRTWDGSAWQPVTDPRIASTAASLTNDYYTKTAADSAIAFSSSALTTAFQQADSATNANLSNNYYTKSAADSAMAASATSLEAKLRARQNLLRNGGFENGMEFWSSGTPGWGVVDSIWGRTCQNTSINTTAIGVLDSTYQIPVQPNETYTISADTVLFASAGSLYVDLLFFNSSNVVVADSGERNRSANHDFSDTNSGRAATEFAVTAPPTAVYARARLVWGSIAGLTVIGIRQVKVERGGLPSTPYSSEATLTYSNAKIDSVSSALTTTTESVAATANTLRTEFASADSANLSAAQGYVQSYAYSKSSVDGAIATKGDQLTSEFQGADEAINANLTNNYFTKAGVNEAVASATTTFQAVIGTNRPNLLKNGGFEARDFQGWTDRSAGSNWQINPTNARWGAIAYVGNGTVAGSHFMLSDPIYVGDNLTVTVSADSEMLCTSGAIYVRPIAFNSAGGILAYGAGHFRSGQHGFGTRPRSENSNEFALPSGTAYIRIEVLFHNMVNPTWMAVRQIKLETGGLPASLYSNDATVTQAYSVIQTEALTRADQTGSLFAKYTVKIDQNGYVSGYGLASETNNGATVSGFQIRADKFSIANPTGPGISPIVPFVVLTTPTVENGVTLPAGVYMDGLYIKSIRADRIDTRGLTVKDSAGNVILGSGSGLPIDYVPLGAKNSSISVSGGKLSGIGTGDGTLVDNTKFGDNLIPDAYYLSPTWWGLASWASINSYPANGANAGIQPAHYLVFSPAAADVMGQYFPIEQHATYRMKIRIYASPAAAGIFWWGMHCPNVQWWSPVPLNGGAVSAPEYGFNLDAVGTNGVSMRGNWTEFVSTIKMTSGDLPNSPNQIQSRIRNVLTAGYVEVHMELTRVFSFDNPGEVVGKIRQTNVTTFIDGAAINYAQIGELRAQNISVSEISKAVNGGATGARVDIDANRVRVFDGVNSFARVTLGYTGS